MRSSLLIISQCYKLYVENKSKFVSTVVSDKKLAFTRKSDLKKNMESLIQHFKYVSEGIMLPSGYSYIGLEAPKGEFGVFLQTSSHQNKPNRCKFKAPGLVHLYGITVMSKNQLLADVVTIIGTQDIVFGEIDR
jgi:NADH-quinone oxidoreductase subunit D